jgi:TRAP-type mannitol/chloroaromatic compound transport system permease large subunit
MRKELAFGVSILGLIVAAVAIMMPWTEMTNGHLGLLMLALIVAAIMLGFPTAFTLMGMGVMFAFFAYMSRTGSTEQAIQQTLDLMVQRAYAVMANDVLIAVPLFVFMGYLVERANLIEKLFKSLHLALVRLPGSLAVATIFTCAVFATATGIVGAVVTLMGLLALPAMLKAGYDTRVSAGSITAGGCLGILIPPSVLLIVYGATAGVSVVQLYAGAFFPGLMLAGLYVLYVIVLAKLRPKLMPPLPESERRVPLTATAARVRDRFGDRALPARLRAIKGRGNAGVAMSDLLRQLFVTLLPALAIALVIGLAWRSATAPTVAVDTGGLEQLGGSFDSAPSGDSGGLAEPAAADGEMSEPPAEDGELAEPEASGDEPAGDTAVADAEPEGAPQAAAPPAAAEAPAAGDAAGAAEAAEGRIPVPTWFWVLAGIGAAILLAYYALLSFVRLEIFRMLLSSFFPLAVLILAVLGAIVFGLATPSEAAAVGSFGGFLLAIAYRQLNRDMMKESVFLTAKTTAMVCWLFVGSSIFSAAFALLGGQELIEQWVLSLGLTKVQFLLLSQVIIFLLGWPLEWTEIIVIFMPIFIPLLSHFDVDPLFFGLLVALNLQTAFLSPPVAMAAFYLKGVAPPHVTLGQIFMGMMPFMAIQVFAIFVLYMFPGVGLWLPEVLYR